MSDTVSAIATAAGDAALGIIRISGPDARNVLHAVVPAAHAHKYPRTIRVGKAVDICSHDIIDEVICFFAEAPHTATGEDVAEIHAHGGRLVMNKLLRQTFKAGARLAEPGEFTRRAYTNGKMDLTQAEAVMSLIGAKSEKAAQTAARQLNGSIGKKLAVEYDQITLIAAALETCLDFPDEDLPSEQTAQFIVQLNSVISKLGDAVRSYHMGQMLTNGAKVVIAGPSNAGKSSLLNALIGEERALVDSAPGTTRDIVEAPFEINGVPITFLDTAGLRFGAKKVEQMGMEKSKRAMDSADLIVLVLDGAASLEIEPDIRALLSAFKERAIVVLNKSDKKTFRADRVAHIVSETIPISVQQGSNIPVLQKTMGEYLMAEQVVPELILTTTRQLTSVESALEHSLSAKRILEADDRAPELAAVEIRWAREALASLWGKHAQADIIDTIFSTFCLGK